MSAPEHFSELRRLFPVTKERLFLSHCTVSPLPQPSVDAIQRHIGDLSRFGGLELAPARNRQLATCREKVASLIGASSEEIAFVGNTVQGINLIANGIRWREGDNIIGGEIEFPANVYPWRNLESRGVKTRLLPARDGRITADDIIAALDSRTRLVAVSLVQFTNGYRLDAARLGEVCRERGIYFFLDAIQGLGALDFDVRRVPVDFLAAGAHKWLLGPMGTGFFYCRREVVDDLEISTIGHRTMISSGEFLPYTWSIRPDAARFEGGAHNAIGVYGFEPSLDLLLRAGLLNIERHVLSLTHRLIEGLERRGYEITSPRAQDSERSGIVSFSSSRSSPEELLARLNAAAIILSKCCGALRAAPHFYNTEDDIERLLSALE